MKLFAKLFTTRSVALALGITVSAAGCATVPYVQATEAFAASTAAAVTALAPAGRNAADLCLRRARLAYLEARVLPGATSPSWNAFREHANAMPGVSWKDYCAEIAAGGQVLSRSLATLAAYGAALNTVATDGSYNGGDLTEAAKSAGAIAGTLGSGGASSALKSAGGPLTRIADMLLARIARGRLKAAIRDGDEPIQGLLTALRAYLEAIDLEARAAESGQRIVISAIEAKLSSPSSPGPGHGHGDDPLGAVNLVRFASRIEDELNATRAALAEYVAVVDRLGQAHAQLKLAGTRKTNAEEETLKVVLGHTAAVFAHAAAARASLQERD